MRRLDDYPIDPHVAAALDAIDATLAGEPVDPEHAELAELALLLASERPEIHPAFAQSLGERVQERFAAGSPRPRPWMLPSVAGLSAAGLAAIVALVVLPTGTTRQPVSGLAAPAQLHASPQIAAAGTAKAPSAPRLGTGSATGAGAGSGAPATKSAGTSAGAAPATSASAPPATSAGVPPATTLQPPANGRKLIQAAQLALTAAPNRIDDVAQEVFDAVGSANGVVNRSTVTATGGPDGYAAFQLSVPSSALPETMSELSRLRYAAVVSRTDTTQDVNNEYVAATRRLADARALRTALLKQLSNATTRQQIDALNAQLHDAEAAIASDEAALRDLNRQINFSQISLTISAGALHVSPGDGSFTIGKAAHVAGRVLTVAAGVALVALAALVPIALLGALAYWIAAAVRRRRREHALDLA